MKENVSQLRSLHPLHDSFLETDNFPFSFEQSAFEMKVNRMKGFGINCFIPEPVLAKQYFEGNIIVKHPVYHFTSKTHTCRKSPRCEKRGENDEELQRRQILRTW